MFHIHYYVQHRNGAVILHRLEDTDRDNSVTIGKCIFTAFNVVKVIVEDTRTGEELFRKEKDQNNTEIEGILEERISA